MTRVLNFKSDYLPPKDPDKNRYGRYVYELGGMDAPGELFNIIPVKPGLVLSYSAHASLPYPTIDFEIGSAPVDFTFCLAGTSTHRYHRFKGQKNIFEFTPQTRPT